MRDQRGNFHWVAVILLACATSALGNTYRVGIGNDCRPGFSFVAPVPPPGTHYAPACFSPAVVAINVGDSVMFYNYADIAFTGPHNVVADDGSFRCARGCDDEGGSGAPWTDSICDPGGCFGVVGISFTREFDVPGIIKYHDEVTGAPGVIYVGIAPAIPINEGFTGTWLDPAQSGMGFMLEILPGSPMRMLASWLTFSPEGDPTWIAGLGSIDDEEAILQATQTVGSGARFPPNFDPENVATQSWGTLTFTFSDCNHGHVIWSSTIPSYGNGGMDLTRLTQPAGVDCIATPAPDSAQNPPRPFD